MRSVRVRVPGGCSVTDGSLRPSVPRVARIFREQPPSLGGPRRCVRRASDSQAVSQSAESSAETQDTPVLFESRPEEATTSDGPDSGSSMGSTQKVSGHSKPKVHSLHAPPRNIDRGPEFAAAVNTFIDMYLNEELDDKQLKQTDPHVLIVSIKLITSEHDIRVANQLLDELVSVGKATDHIAAVFLKQCCIGGRLEFAKQCVMSWLKMNDFPLGAGCSDVMIRSLVEDDDLQGGLEMLEDFQIAGVALRPFAYNILIQAAGQRKELDTAIKLFHQLLASPYGGPDVFTYRNILWAVRAKSSKEYLSVVYSHFIEESKVPMCKNLYYAFMTCASKCQNVEVAEGIFDLFVKEDQHYRSAKVFNVFLDVYSKSAILPEPKRIFELYDQYNIKMDDFSFGLLVTAAYRSQASLEVIDYIRSEMEARGVQWNPLTGASFIIAYKGAELDPFKDRFKRAVEVCRKVRTQTCYHLLMAMTSENGYLSLALRFQHEMEGLGYATNQKTYNILYEGCMGSGMAARAEKFKEMRDEMFKRERAKMRNEN